MYITTYLGSNPPGVKLSAAATSRLQVETGSNLKRLLTICDSTWPPLSRTRPGEYR